MTGQSADFFGFKDRGRIAVGHFADLVLLDPTTVLDQANIKNSKADTAVVKLTFRLKAIGTNFIYKFIL
jgi:N-acyl-D-aspartate/D-glutamate deacylase